MIIPQQLLFWGRRFFLYGSVVAIGVFLIVVAVGSYRSNPQASTTQASVKQFGITSVAAPTQAPTALFASTAALALVSLPAFAETPQTTDNATRKLAAKLSQEFIRLNPNGPGSPLLGGTRVAVPKAEELVNEFLKKGVDNFDTASFTPTIRDADIHISESSDSQALVAYIRSFFTILNHSVTPAPLPDDQRAVSIISNIYAGYISALYRLDVPRPLLAIHKEELVLLISAKRALDAVRSYNDDPLRAILALSVFEQSKTTMAKVYTKLAYFISDHQLQIIP